MHTRQLPIDVAPWTLFRALARKERPFFIDAGQPWASDWVSCMGFHPRMQLRITAGTDTAPPLQALDAALARIAPPPGSRARERPVPFAGGAIVALAYEAKNTIERLPQTQREEPTAPRLACALYEAVVAYVHRQRRWVVASWHLDDLALARYAEEVLDAAADARHLESRAPGEPPAYAHPPSIARSLEPEEYRERVARVQAYIAAGDVYQVNVSQRFAAPLPCPPLDLYGHLRRVQPVPFGGYFDLGPEQVLSNSPELFLRRRGDRVETCPIKGTRRRGSTRREEEGLVAELRADLKERAEHVMIVDLERNDLGRVCRTGSVRVTRFAELLTLRTVHHLVSTVSGDLRTGVTAGALLRATFPGGSITGAPKIRAMEIIDELERGPRGLYTGALGWIDASGDLDLNVAIRTATVTADTVSYHAGSGIVADSQPEREHAECLLKARALFEALGLAGTPARRPGSAGGGQRGRWAR